VESNPVTGKAEGHFHARRPDGAPQGVLMVNMGERTNVDSFSTRYDMLRPVEVQARVVETSAPTGLSATADRPRTRPLGKQPTTQAGQTRKILLDRTGAGNVGFLQVEAEAAVAESAFAITAEGELHTVAYGGLLRAKRPVEVAGAGRQFSGAYYVDRVSHVFSNDRYTQRFLLRRNAVGL
jgi:hypothetical protein